MPAGKLDAQVSNGTEKECVGSVVKSDVYLEGEASSPLYRRVLVITVFGCAEYD